MKVFAPFRPFNRDARLNRDARRTAWHRLLAVGTSLAFAVAGAIVTAAPAASSSAPAISGTVQVDQTVSAAHAASAGTTAVSYSWAAAGVETATTASYLIRPADADKPLTVTVTEQDDAGNLTSHTSAPVTVARGELAITAEPYAAGTPRYGQTLTARTGTWTPGTNFSYQWLRNGVAVEGATASTFALWSTSVGTSISVRIIGRKSGYNPRGFTTVARTVTKGLFTVTSPPFVKGNLLVVGQSVSAATGAWAPAASSYSYRWLRDGVPIPGASGAAYRLSLADGGHRLSVRVTAHRSYYYSRYAISAAVSIQRAPRTVMYANRAYLLGSQVRAGFYKATGTGSTCEWAVTDSSGRRMGGYYGPGNTFAQIPSGAATFASTGCGSWQTVTVPRFPVKSFSAGGTYRVGIDVAAGQYQAAAPTSACYSEVLTGFSGSTAEVRAATRSAVLTIPADARGFFTSGCGTWSRTS